MTKPPVAVDYETFYDGEVSIRTMGAWNYCAHPDWDAYMVSIVGNGVEFVGHPDQAPWEKVIDCDWVSHNAMFDQTVHRQIGKPLPSGDWHCSSDLAAFRGCKRSLADSSKFLLGKEVSKGMRNYMKGKRWVDAVNDGKAAALEQYALDDSKLCLEIWNQEAGHWPDIERQLSLHTRRMAERGMLVDKDLISEAGERVWNRREEVYKEIPWAPTEEKPLSLNKLKRYLKGQNVPAPKSTALDSDEYLAWEAKYGEHSGVVKLMSEFRRLNKVARSLQTLERFVRADGTLATQLKYFGAHTGRWSGDGGFNFQNMPAGELAGVDVRRFFVPRDGKKFLICDLSQIEARILAWLVKDEDFLDAVRKGQSPYEAHARATMGWTGGKLKAEDPEKYKLAKMRVLGLGYGCGWFKFKTIARLWAGWDLSDDEAKRIVYDFRHANGKIITFWRRVEDLAKRQARSQKGADFTLDLPSGRSLLYRNLEASDGHQCQLMATPILGKPARGMYGGILTENVVQAIARDVMAEAILRLERAGLRVLLHVHDEAVMEVDPDTDVREVEEIMCQVPDWLKGCPIGAEAELADFYKK